MSKTKSPKTNKTKRSDEELNDISSSQEQTPPKDGSASKRRKEKLGQDESYIEMPDVSDIPGQEGIVNAGVPGAMKDTTASSDDEEGVRQGEDIFKGDDDEVNIVMGTEADVTEEDLEMLGDPDQDQDMNEDEFIDKEGLDNTDFDGDPLNEAAVSEVSSGDDLDVPEEREEDPKKTADDDEENDYYSLGGPDNDALNEGRKDDDV